VSFEEALATGELDAALAALDALAEQPDHGDLYLPECFGDLAQRFAEQRRYDDAIAAQQRAIDTGSRGRPDPRSDIAEFHLRAGRDDEAARLWAQLETETPDDVWLYNAAGLSYREQGDDERALPWLTKGIELAMRDDDPEGVVAQLSDARRASLAALGRPLDELEREVDTFLEHWRQRDRERRAHAARRAAELDPAASAWPRESPSDDEIAVALAWFPAGDYERALARWPSLAEDWADVPHRDYCRRMEGHLKWLRAAGAPVRAVAPIELDSYLPWCEQRSEDPEDARAAYAADAFRGGHAIAWPPARNEPCWCGSERKYKKCCGPADPAPMHGAPDA
jgi:tetratricopeptide (TPR) repeat protein